MVASATGGVGDRGGRPQPAQILLGPSYPRSGRPPPQRLPGFRGAECGGVGGGTDGPRAGRHWIPLPGRGPPGGLVDAARSQRAAMVPLNPHPHLRRTHVGFSLQHPVLPSSRRPAAHNLMKNQSGHGPPHCVMQGLQPRGPPRLSPGVIAHCLETLFSRSGGARHRTTWD